MEVVNTNWWGNDTVINFEFDEVLMAEQSPLLADLHQ